MEPRALLKLHLAFPLSTIPSELQLVEGTAAAVNKSIKNVARQNNSSKSVLLNALLATLASLASEKKDLLDATDSVCDPLDNPHENLLPKIAQPSGNDTYYADLIESETRKLGSLKHTKFFFTARWHAWIGPLLLKEKARLPSMTRSLTRIIWVAADSLASSIHIGERLHLYSALTRMISYHSKHLLEALSFFETKNPWMAVNMIDKSSLSLLTNLLKPLHLHKITSNRAAKKLIGKSSVSILRHSHHKGKCSSLTTGNKCSCGAVEAILAIPAPGHKATCLKQSEDNPEILIDPDNPRGPILIADRTGDIRLTSRGEAKGGGLGNDKDGLAMPITLLGSPVYRLSRDTKAKIIHGLGILFPDFQPKRMITSECRFPSGNTSNPWITKTVKLEIGGAGLIRTHLNCKYFTEDGSVTVSDLKLLGAIQGKISTGIGGWESRLIHNITHFLQSMEYIDLKNPLTVEQTKEIMKNLEQSAKSEATLRESIQRATHKGWWESFTGGMFGKVGMVLIIVAVIGLAMILGQAILSFTCLYKKYIRRVILSNKKHSMQLDLLNKKLEEETAQKPGNPISLSQLESEAESSPEETGLDSGILKADETPNSKPTAPELREESKQESFFATAGNALMDSTRSALHTVEVVTETAIRGVQGTPTTIGRI